MHVSVIINTYNRASYLQRLLAGLEHLKNAEFEVIVVNGPSTDGTQALLEQYQGCIKILSCPSRNLSQSRNLGIAAAAGDIVAFIDDDALPCDVEWLTRYIREFQNNEQVGAAWGPVLHRDTHWFEFRNGATSDYAFQAFEAAQSSIAPDEGPWTQRGPGGNIAFHRNKLASLGGFDEFYVYYLDETDVCLRLSHAGFVGVNIPANNIRHYSGSSKHRTSQYDRNWEIIARSDTYFALKNAHDSFPTRLFKTLRFASQKHFVQEIDQYRKNAEITHLHWLRLRWKWLRGLLSGLWAGLTQKRRLGDFSAPPPPFLPFHSEHTDNLLRIVLLTQTVPGQPNYGGIGRYTFDLARGLHKRGHEVHILCRDENSIHYESLGFVIHGLSATETTSRTLAGQRPVLNKNLSYALAVEKKLADLYARGIEFDVVHASNWDAEAVALIRERVYPTALMLVTPLAQVIQTEKWSPNDDLDVSVALDRWQIEHADAVCVPSRGVLKSYQNLMGLEAENLRTLQITPLGIVPEAVIPEELQPKRKHFYNLLFVGRLEWRKGAHTLLDALPDLMPHFPEWECHIVGDDSIHASDGKTFKQLFQEKNHSELWLNRVIFHGVVSESELMRFYQSCDLFVAPSLFESFGLIFQEAMQYGKAVVGCHTGGIPEVVEHGVEGLLVTPDSPSELRDALAQLMQDDELRDRMGEAGKQRIWKRDNYLTMAMRLEEVYQSLILTKGKKYKDRRKSLWPRQLPLLISDNFTLWDGPWEICEPVPDRYYCHGMPGASLDFNTRGGSLLEVTGLCDTHSGVLKITINGTVHQYIDFYSSSLELSHLIQIELPQMGEPLAVRMQVHTEHNPNSFGSEIWLEQVRAILA